MFDKLLHVKTTGRDDSRADQYHYPYEPTPYSVLERLANSGYITKKNTLVDYGVSEEADRFYFFNPFSVTLLRKVLNKIEESYYQNPREMLFFFYYPSDEYVAYLMTKDSMSFFDEIDCRDLFDGDNKREKILIFELT